MPKTCGDSEVYGDEECDDGNTEDGDGCSATCEVEPRWVCHGAPSVCECAAYLTGEDCAGCLVYVSSDATGMALDGETWDSAFSTVQEGIDTAHAHGPGCEVWVAKGVYYIYQGTRLDSVALLDGVAVYGGFAGDETVRGERDLVANETVLDGRSASDAELQVYHVVTSMNTQDATLDGLTITGGWASQEAEYPESKGGGCTPTVRTWRSTTAPSSTTGPDKEEGASTSPGATRSPSPAAPLWATRPGLTAAA